MGGKAYRQDNRIHKIFKGTVEAKKVFFKNYEVFSSSHDVAYHADVDNIIMKEIEDETDIISQAPVVTKTGWLFVGWRLDTEPDPDVLVEYLATEDDIHVYAVFEKDVNLTLVGGDTTLYQSGIRYYNNGNYRNPIITLETAVLTGWTLVGYRLDTNPDATVPYYGGQAYAFAQDTTLYTVFKQTVTLRVQIKGTTYTYPRTRYVNNGNYNNPVVYVDDQTLDDAVFLGYSDDPSSTTVVIATLSTGYTLTQDVHFYAVWRYNDAVLDTSTHRAYRRDTGTVRVTTLDITKYVRLTITASVRITMATWHIENNATLRIVGVAYMVAHKGGAVGDWIEVPVSGTRTWWSGGDGEEANADPQTLTTGDLPANSSFDVDVSLSGDVSPWGDHDESGATVTYIKGIGRTIVY